MKMRMNALAVIAGLAIATTSHAADIAKKAAAISYNYPTTHCGMYYGVNTLGSTGSVVGAGVPAGTQVAQGAVGLTLGYTCPVGAGYWFVDGMFDFSNLNGSANGFSLTGPAKFEERFGFGAPIDMVMSLIPGLTSLKSSMPSLIPLPTGVAVVTSNPYLFGSFHQDDTGLATGLAANKQYLLSAGFGMGNKVRLSNGVVFDPFAEFILPSSQMCIGVTVGCVKRGSEVLVGAALEF